jgi:hypothetical protein
MEHDPQLQRLAKLLGVVIDEMREALERMAPEVRSRV